MRHPWPIFISAILVFTVSLNACLGTPGTTVTNAGEVVYSAGARQDNVAVILAASPGAVFDSLIREIMKSENVAVIERSDASRTVEVTLDGRNLRAEATEYNGDETLLFLWADAGDTGLTGNEVAMSTINTISLDLDVNYELVENGSSQ